MKRELYKFVREKYSIRVRWGELYYGAYYRGNQSHTIGNLIDVDNEILVKSGVWYRGRLVMSREEVEHVLNNEKND